MFWMPWSFWHALSSSLVAASTSLVVTWHRVNWVIDFFFSSSLADVALWLGPYMSISGKTSLCTRTKTVWKCRQITTTTTTHNPARRPANPPARLAFRQEKQQTRQTKGAGAQTKTTTKEICQRTQWFDHCIILKNMRKWIMTHDIQIRQGGLTVCRSTWHRCAEAVHEHGATTYASLSVLSDQLVQKASRNRITIISLSWARMSWWSLYQVPPQ